MQYKTIVLENTFLATETLYVLVSFTEDSVTTFPADESNTDYVQFLINAQLTDTEVHELPVNTWFDFPLEEQA